MVGPGRLELPTPRLSSVCSNQLSYGPDLYELDIRDARKYRPEAVASRLAPFTNPKTGRRLAIEDRGTAVRTYPYEERET